MKLNKEQMQRLSEHLQKSFKQPCMVCGGTNWQFDDTLFELRQFMGGGISNQGLIKPAVAVTCATCAQIILVNAIAIGVLQVQATGEGDRPEESKL
jgi:hypothetical protein